MFVLPCMRSGSRRRVLGLGLSGLVAVLAGGLPGKGVAVEPAPPAPATAAGAGAGVATAESVEFFEKSVRPVLVDHCYSCHSQGSEKLRGELRLDSRAGWQRGGASGKASVIPGDPEASLLIRAVRHGDADLAMPPKKKLPPEAIAALETWVRMGAPDPREGGKALPDPREMARRHWAFQPVASPRLPEVRRKDWVRNPIDRFVLAGLEARGLEPSAPADRRTLIRRASQVLTGLPPTLEEVAAFEVDDRPGAFERVVERLLSSPRYGERWARHWLDVARYADTKGYVFEEERRYPYAYTYRDYVIRAFNEDKPYDRFLVEQIAADRLVQEAGEGADRSILAGMGFLTLGRRFLNNPHDIIDDRIDVLMRGTLALTVACARCHDHKYDPIPIADYYSLYGVFASSQEPAEKPLLGTIPDGVRHAEFTRELARREKERDDFVRGKEEEHRVKLRRTVGDHLLAAQAASALADGGKREELARARQLSPLVVNRWVAAMEGWAKPGAADTLFGAWRALAALPGEGFAGAARPVAAGIAANADARHDPAVAKAFGGEPPASLEDVARRYNAIFSAPEGGAVAAFLVSPEAPFALTPDQVHTLFNVQEGQRKRALQRAVEELAATHPGAPPRAMALADQATPVEPVIFKRGNPGNRGDTVPRQFLGLLAGPDRKPFGSGSGRLELARAIASPDNPLTARVAVNRVWLHLFGAALVRTPADFGLRSEPPTHPELLDWLASTLVAEGWSIKQLHRVILASATWQQGSEGGPGLVAADPDNRLWGRQNRRRLDFEAMRDLLLLASGRLDLTMGGHSVEIAARDYVPRRTVYGFVERQNLPGVFRTFDFASPDTSSAQRFQTTVPQQALFLLNSPFSLDQARRLAAREEVAGLAEPDARIGRLYELVLQRRPEEDEVLLARRFLDGQSGGGATPGAAAGPVWRQGTGLWDEEAQVVRGFRDLPHFTGTSWQGGATLPDPGLGWIHLTAEGGHPGSRGHGPAVRRWTAPWEGVVEVAGTLKHPGEAGDGVRAAVVSSRHGAVGQWSVRKGSAETRVARVGVLAGDTLDFVVACGENENTDGFQWAPRVVWLEPVAAGAPAPAWDARADFAGPGAGAVPLSGWERYAQVLLMSNEAVFVD